MFVSVSLFHLSLIFEGMEGVVTRVGSGLAHKCKTRVEVTDRDKFSILLQYGINYGRKKLYSTSHRLRF